MSEYIKLTDVSEQVTGKLNKADDSLLTEDSEGVKEQKSKLEKLQLSHETSTNSKKETVDLISRQAAISIPIIPKEHRKCFKDMDDAFETGWNEALSCVNMLPSADRPTGEWVEVVHRTEQYDREGIKSWAVLYQCPSCGFILNAIEGHKEQYKFCPSCGADMRGEK